MRIILVLAVIFSLAACGGSSEPATSTPPPSIPTIESTLVPTLTFTPIPTLQAEDYSFDIATMQVAIIPEETEDALQFVVSPNEEEAMDPPIELNAPDGWQYGNLVTPVEDIIGYRLIPTTIYRGPVPGGTGYIVLFWGFYNITLANNPLMAQTNVGDTWLDGIRLLRLALIEPDCRYGTGDRKDNLRVGNVLGSGADWSAVDCDTSADTRGWFVATTVDGLSFVFYVYGEPIDVMDNPATVELLQGILDSVEFKVVDFIDSMRLPEVTPEVTNEP